MATGAVTVPTAQGLGQSAPSPGPVAPPVTNPLIYAGPTTTLSSGTVIQPTLQGAGLPSLSQQISTIQSQYPSEISVSEPWAWSGSTPVVQAPVMQGVLDQSGLPLYQFGYGVALNSSGIPEILSNGVYTPTNQSLQDYLSANHDIYLGSDVNQSAGAALEIASESATNLRETLAAYAKAGLNADGMMSDNLQQNINAQNDAYNESINASQGMATAAEVNASLAGKSSADILAAGQGAYTNTLAGLVAQVNGLLQGMKVSPVFSIATVTPAMIGSDGTLNLNAAIAANHGTIEQINGNANTFVYTGPSAFNAALAASAVNSLGGIGNSSYGPVAAPAASLPDSGYVDIFGPGIGPMNTNEAFNVKLGEAPSGEFSMFNEQGQLIGGGGAYAVQSGEFSYEDAAGHIINLNSVLPGYTGKIAGSNAQIPWQIDLSTPAVFNLPTDSATKDIDTAVSGSSIAQAISTLNQQPVLVQGPGFGKGITAYLGIEQPSGALDLYGKDQTGDYGLIAGAGMNAAQSDAFTVTIGNKTVNLATMTGTPLVYNTAGVTIAGVPPGGEVGSVSYPKSQVQQIDTAWNFAKNTPVPAVFAFTPSGDIGAPLINNFEPINPKSIDLTQGTYSVIAPGAITGTMPTQALATGPITVNAPLTGSKASGSIFSIIESDIEKLVQPVSFIETSLLFPQIGAYFASQQINNLISESRANPITDQSNPVLVTTEGLSMLGDTLFAGMWTPGKNQITALGFNNNNAVTSFETQQENLQKESSFEGTLKNTIDTEESQINILDKGNLDSQGMWTGSASDLSKRNDLVATRESNVNSYNAFISANENLIESGYKSGVIIPTGNGQYAINPNYQTSYGQFSNWYNSAWQGFEKDIGMTPITPAMYAEYEASPSFANLPWYNQAQEAILKTITTQPQEVAAIPVTAAEMYIGFDLLTGYFPALASPAVTAVAGSASASYGMWQATAGGTLPESQRASNLATMGLGFAGTFAFAGFLSYATPKISNEATIAQWKISDVASDTYTRIQDLDIPARVSNIDADTVRNTLSIASDKFSDMVVKSGDTLQSITGSTYDAIKTFDIKETLSNFNTRITTPVYNYFKDLTYSAPARVTSVTTSDISMGRNFYEDERELQVSTTTMTQYFERPSLDIPIIGKVYLPFLPMSAVGEPEVSTVTSNIDIDSYAIQRGLNPDLIGDDFYAREYMTRTVDFVSQDARVYLRGEESLFGAQATPNSDVIEGTPEYDALWNKAMENAKTPVDALEKFSEMTSKMTSKITSYGSSSVAFTTLTSDVSLNDVWEKGIGRKAGSSLDTVLQQWNIITEAPGNTVTTRVAEIQDISPYVNKVEVQGFNTFGGDIIESTSVAAERASSRLPEFGTVTTERVLNNPVTGDVGITQDIIDGIKASDDINALLGSKFSASEKPVIGERQAILQNIMDRLSATGSTATNIGRIEGLTFGETGTLAAERGAGIPKVTEIQRTPGSMLPIISIRNVFTGDVDIAPTTPSAGTGGNEVKTSGGTLITESSPAELETAAMPKFTYMNVGMAAEVEEPSRVSEAPANMRPASYSVPMVTPSSIESSMIPSIPKIEFTFASGIATEVSPDITPIPSVGNISINDQDKNALPALGQLPEQGQNQNNTSGTAQVPLQGSGQTLDQMQDVIQQEISLNQYKIVNYDIAPPNNPVPALPPVVWPNSGSGYAPFSKRRKGPIQIELFTIAPSRKNMEALGLAPATQHGKKFYRTLGDGKVAEINKAEDDRMVIVDHKSKGNTVFSMPSVKMPKRRKQ